jgi:predicted aldo/keto reductase-like oxidoreductase
MLWLDAIQGNIFVILLGQDVSVSDTIDTTLSILVSIRSSLVVPLQSQINVLRRMDTQLVKVTHGEFSSWETSMSGSVGIDIRQLLMLWEKTFMTNEEPFADSHVGFGFALLCSKTIVM